MPKALKLANNAATANEKQKQKQNFQTHTFDGQHSDHEISFDQLLGEENMFSGVDGVFNTIQLNCRKQQNRDKSSHVVRDRLEFNRKLEEQLSKSKSRHKKQTSSLTTEKQIKQQHNASTRNYQQLLAKLTRMKEQSQQQKQALRHKIQQLTNKSESLNRQIKLVKQQNSRKDKHIHQKQQKLNRLKQKTAKMQQQMQQMQKKLRVKEKQMKKMQQFQEQRSKYYNGLFGQKGEEIEKLNTQLMRKNEEIFMLTDKIGKLVHNQTEAHKKLQLIFEESQQLRLQIVSKTQVIESTTVIISEGITLMEQHLKQPIDTNSNSNHNSNFSSITTTKYSSHHKSTNLSLNKNLAHDEAQIRYFLSLVKQVIERNDMIACRRKAEIQNFQGAYHMQLQDLDHKMTNLIQENRHLRVKNDEINRSFNSVTSRQPIKNQFNSEQFKKYMSSAKAHYSKIKQEVLSTKTAQVIEQIQKARRIYKEASLRSQSVKNLRSKSPHIQMSEQNLFKRSRRSLSWKKPPQIMKQYL